MIQDAFELSKDVCMKTSRNLALVRVFFLYLIIAKICLLLCTSGRMEKPESGNGKGTSIKNIVAIFSVK